MIPLDHISLVLVRLNGSHYFAAILLLADVLQFCVDRSAKLVTNT
jgi:hypothetical protein